MKRLFGWSLFLALTAANAAYAASGFVTNLGEEQPLPLPIPEFLGGTGATTGSQALINLIGPPTLGSCLVGDGTNWTTETCPGSGGPSACPSRQITSGTADTATIDDCQILWRSADEANKTQTFPACNSSAGDKTFWVTDDIQTASLWSIRIVPVSGTINGASDVTIEASAAGLMLRCNVLTSDWVAQ